MSLYGLSGGLYGRNHLSDIISEAAKDIFVPITVGGGIRSIDDATDMRAGADKVAINTAAITSLKSFARLSEIWKPKYGSFNRGQENW